MEKLKLDRLLDAIAKAGTTILAAHNSLGIPLEDLVCSAVRKAASKRVIDATQQELKLQA